MLLPGMLSVSLRRQLRRPAQPGVEGEPLPPTASSSSSEQPDLCKCPCVSSGLSEWQSLKAVICSYLCNHASHFYGLFNPEM